MYWLDKFQKVETVTGFWVIFVPFAPATLWALCMYFAATKLGMGLNMEAKQSINGHDENLKTE